MHRFNSLYAIVLLCSSVPLFSAEGGDPVFIKKQNTVAPSVQLARPVKWLLGACAALCMIDSVKAAPSVVLVTPNSANCLQTVPQLEKSGIPCFEVEFVVDSWTKELRDPLCTNQESHDYLQANLERAAGSRRVKNLKVMPSICPLPKSSDERTRTFKCIDSAFDIKTDGIIPKRYLQ